MAHQDIFEQIVEEYLIHKGYFVQHNVKFKPAKDDPNFSSKKDSVASDGCVPPSGVGAVDK